MATILLLVLLIDAAEEAVPVIVVEEVGIQVEEIQ